MSKGSNRRPEDRKAIDDNWGKTFGRNPEAESAKNQMIRAMIDGAAIGTGVISKGVRIDPLSIYKPKLFEDTTKEEQRASFNEALDRVIADDYKGGPFELLARRLGLWAVPGEYMGSSTLHNNKLLEFAEAIKKRKTYTTIRPVIATGDTIQFGSAVSFQNAKDWLDGKMVCGNCGHANDIMACKHPEIRSFLQNNTEVDFLVTSDFGCNNWEAK